MGRWRGILCNLGRSSSCHENSSSSPVLSGVGSCLISLLVHVPWFPWPGHPPRGCSGLRDPHRMPCRTRNRIPGQGPREKTGARKCFFLLQRQLCDLERCGPECSCFHSDITSEWP